MPKPHSKKPTNPYLIANGPCVLAHRGGGGLAPENTIPAFDNALAMQGVTALEIDVHQTADGIVVVAHDDILDRISDGKGYIRDYTLYELQKFDAGYTWTNDNGESYPFRGQGIYIPTLEEIFDRFGQDLVINIDIKQRKPSMVAALVKVVRHYKMTDRVVIGSFYNDTVRELRKLAPEIATAGSLAEVRRFYLLNKLGLSRFYRGKSVAFQIPEKAEGRTVITPRFVRNLQKHGVQLHVWTINKEADMQRLLSWGVDGIVSDRPDLLLDVIAQRQA